MTERCSPQGSGDSFVRQRVVPGVYDDERADGQYVPVKKLCWRLSFSVAGPWKGASGHTRLVRENLSSVAADRRRYLVVCLHTARAVGGFLVCRVVWIGGAQSKNVVPRHPSSQAFANGLSVSEDRFCNPNDSPRHLSSESGIWPSVELVPTNKLLSHAIS